MEPEEAEPGHEEPRPRLQADQVHIPALEQTGQEPWASHISFPQMGTAEALTHKLL